MRKFYIIGLIGLAAVIIGLAWAEQITLSTYYPAPYGVYRDFEAKRNATFATELSDPSDPSSSLVGKVGIGTDTPTEMLHVQNGRIWAEGGFILSTEVPGSPEDGQMWLDLSVTP